MIGVEMDAPITNVIDRSSTKEQRTQISSQEQRTQSLLKDEDTNANTLCVSGYLCFVYLCMGGWATGGESTKHMSRHTYVALFGALCLPKLIFCTARNVLLAPCICCLLPSYSCEQLKTEVVHHLCGQPYVCSCLGCTEETNEAAFFVCCCLSVCP